jgi:hypothetical protein
MDATMPVQEHGGRVLDWRPRFDERSLAYRIGAGVTELPATGRIWKHGPVLDQGREGACVGFGCAGDAAAEPVPAPGITNQYALTLYRRAQRLDQWDGEAYSGTSVLAGCLAGRERGLWSGFRWATSAEELAAGIVRTASKGGGPAIIGVEWRAGSYATDALGVLRPSGDVVGGHCLLVLGFVPAGVEQGGRLEGQLMEAGLWDGYLSVGGPVFVILNSWGPGFGKQGLALVPVDVVRGWFRAGGEFAIPVERALPKVAAAELITAEPATAGPDETLHVRAWQVRDRDRIVDGVPAELGQETVTVRSRRLVAGGNGDLVRVHWAAGVFTLRVSDRVVVRRAVA